MPIVVRNPSEAYLVVHSAIAVIQFESNNEIFQVENRSVGEYILHLKPGTHIIKFKADGFMTEEKRFHITAKDYKEVRVSVTKDLIGDKANLGTVEFEMEPGLVVVIQDDIQVGEFTISASGILNMSLSPGKHSFRLIRSGTQYFDLEVNVEAKKTIRKKVDFKGGLKKIIAVSGILFIKSQPSEATVFIDGIEAGKTPKQVEEIGVGKHQVKIEKFMYQSKLLQVDIMPDAVITLDEILKPDFGSIKLNSEPSEANVCFDGKLVGKTPYVQNMVSTGSHTILLSLTNFHDVIWNFNINASDQIDTTIILSPAFGSLEVLSRPEGSEVYLDNQLAGKTPVSIDTISSGQYILRVEKKLFNTLQTTTNIYDGQTTTIGTPLDPNYGTLNILSTPSNISIRLEGKSNPLGKTPLNRDISPGSYTVIFEDDLYETFTKNILLRVGDTIDIDTQLIRKLGSLKIFTEPMDADVFIDGKYLGKSPYVLKDYPTGTYAIEAKYPGYHAKAERVEIEHKKIKTIDLNLDRGCPPNTGIFKFSIMPGGTEITHNGKTLEQAPGTFIEVPAGEHKFKFKKKYFEGSGTQIFTLANQQTIRLEYNAVPKSKGKAIKKSLLFSGWGQYYSEKNTKGTVFLLSQLASFGGIYYMYYNYDKKKGEYNSAFDNYNNAISASEVISTSADLTAAEYNLYDAEKMLYASIGVAAGIYLINVFDSMIFGGAPKSARDGNKLSLAVGCSRQRDCPMIFSSISKRF